MNNFKLHIQYDGSRYKGWQRLGNGEHTIQAKIEAVLSELVGKEIEIIGCSRTDAGVHASEQIANFKTHKNLTSNEVQTYLNKYLPQDICIKKVTAVDDRFHARYNAKDKTYLYKIWNEPYTNPFMRKYSMHVEHSLNLVELRKASKFFVGEHDFTAYSNAKSKKKTMVRTISEVTVQTADGFVEIRVKGDGFLYNMVRKIVGTLIDVGLGSIAAEDVPEIITSKERNQTGRLAEAQGLFLEKIQY